MRLFRIATNYNAYLAEFFARRPHLADAPYAEQYAALAADAFGWADFMTRVLEPLGYTVWEPVINAEALQKRWAVENGVRWADRTWMCDILAAQLRAFRPEVVLVHAVHLFTPQDLAQWRAICPSLRRILIWCGSPFRRDDVFAAGDLVLSNIPRYVDYFRSRSIACRPFDHGFAHWMRDAWVPTAPAEFDFSFVGSLDTTAGGHHRRAALLAALARRTPITLFVEGQFASPLAKARRRAWRRAVDAWHRLSGRPVTSPTAAVPRVTQACAEVRHPSAAWPDLRTIARRARPGRYGRAMFQTLGASRITLNTHIDEAFDQASNMRLFEATGMGTCLLTERQADLARFFEPDREVVTYADADEAVEKVRYLLDHPHERQAIAAAGQRRTLAEHTLIRRMERFDRIVREHI